MGKKLFLIDGYSLIFKMYYAFLKRPMINSKGADMSVLFGVTKYVLELIESEKPTHVAMSFDPIGGTFRHKLYPEYKGTRLATPQLIIDARKPLLELCDALNITALVVPDFEADDVIGTMAVRAEKEGFQVYMVTPDKDYGQLVSKDILQYKPGKSGSDKEILGPAEVCAKYGINSPVEVIDMLAICGDTTDNVPGVKGVGEVGAGKLISKYGSLRGIYEHLDELPPKQREAFEAAKDHIAMSRELVTIRTDAPLDIDPNSMEVNTVYPPKAVDLFNEYEFNSLKKYLGDVAGSVPVETNDLEYTQTDASQVVTLARKVGKCSIITECYDDTIFSPIKEIWMGAKDGEKYFVARGGAEEFKTLLQDAGVAKIGYDLKKQRNVLRYSGIQLQGKFLDIELMHYVINPEQSHRIEFLSKRYLNIDLEQQRQEPVSLFDKTPEQLSRAKEVAVTLFLGEKVRENLLETEAFATLYDQVEEPLLSILSDMECEGVKVDMEQLTQYATGLSDELAQIQARIRELAGEPEFNAQSTRQVGYVIYEKLALDPKIKKAGKDKRYSYPTDEETLTALADKSPIIGEILEYRAIKKLLSTYIEPFPNLISPKTGKVHTTFNQALTATGRLSSSKPNLQNIPIRTDRGREIRKAFVPSAPDGVIVSADYSQIELRIMAHLSGDEHLVEAFREGKDVHRATASKIFGTQEDYVSADERRIAKTANFGIMYGISAFGLSQRLKMPRFYAKKIMDDYFANFPAVSSYIEKAIASAREFGYAETLFGRRRYLPDINSKNANVRSVAERNAVNAPIQGTAADIIKKAMIGVAKRINAEGLKSRMVLQVHDELVFDALQSEVDTLKKIVLEEMGNVIQLAVPLTVECYYGKNWLEAH